MRYCITLSYNGADFCGWQFQPDVATVQETVRKAISTLLREDISITGAGRTDTLVSAVGYVAHFDTSVSIDDTAGFCYKLNAILPRSVVVTDVEKAPSDFHARFSAKRREYTYYLNTAKDPFVENFSFRCTYPLDVGRMNEAAGLLKGTHDFSCFEKKGSDNKTSICTVYEARWESYNPTVCAGNGEYLAFHIAADRFLRNMVRAVVGTLIEVGRGRRSVGNVGELLSGGGDRCSAGESVSGHALFLTRVQY